MKKTATPSLAQWLATPVGPKRHRSYRVRLMVQAAFAATCLVIGYQLGRFYLSARAGELPLPHRPPGAEGFLPISGLMGILDWAIFSMSAAALQAFIQSPYNKVADVKMGLFFVNLGQVGISVMVVLVVGSVFIQGLWCRYLCPYGALLGLFSWLSPVRIRRTADSCIDCSLCDQVCMARLPISRLDVVRSVECTGCVDCLAVCPVNSTLVLAAGPRRLGIPAYAAAVVLLFLLGTVVARLTGVWHNDITDQEYVQRFQEMERPEYGHPGAYEPSDRADQ